MSAKPRIAIGADHGGYELKEQIKNKLCEMGYAIVDCGTNSTATVDYPRFAHAVATQVSEGNVDVGIMVDRAGIGSAMAANKLPRRSCSVVLRLVIGANSREHNNANVLTLGAGLVGPDLAGEIVQTWLSTECSVDRHLRRAAMIEPEEMMASRQTSETGTTKLGSDEAKMTDQLSETDIERIVQRIVQLSGASGSASDNLACAMFQACAATNPQFIRELIDLGAARVGHVPGDHEVPVDLAGFIDHTLLKPAATEQEIAALCDEAAKFEFASVCVNPTYVRLAAEKLRGTKVRVCTVVGFPLGAHVPGNQGARSAPSHARRRQRDRHGDQRRSVKEQQRRVWCFATSAR